MGQIIYEFQTFSEIVACWPSSKMLGEDCETKHATARAWGYRDWINPEWWNRVISAAKKRGYRGINLKTMADIAERKKLGGG